MSAPLLLIGGLDSSGGAGILRDAATAAQHGVPYRTAVTAVTAQTDAAVTTIHLVPAPVIRAQIAAAGEVAAIKIGMLGTAAIVTAIADALPPVPLVLDPVLRASSGRALLDPPGLRLLIGRLLPRCMLLTPNLPELALLGRALGLPEGTTEAEIAAALIAAGARNVLVKGGHAATPGRCEDRLYRATGTVLRFAGPRHRATLRGTGCQLATGIAAEIALGRALPEAIPRARALLAQRFAAAEAATTAHPCAPP